MTKDEVAQKYPKAVWHQDGFDCQQAKYTGGSESVPTHIQQKPWGFEIWLIFNDCYAFKRLIVNQGRRLSYQFHQKKFETWIFKKGIAKAIINDREIIFQPGDVFHLLPGTKHRLIAENNDIILDEVSTCQLDDVVRLEDEYNRL